MNATKARLEITWEPLSIQERRQLAACENEMEKRREAWRIFAISAEMIRDGRLYRETHATFEKYCLDRWKMSRQEIYHLIRDNTAVREMEEATGRQRDSTKINKNQARALQRITTPEVRAGIIDELTRGGRKTTAAEINRRANEVASAGKTAEEQLAFMNASAERQEQAVARIEADRKREDKRKDAGVLRRLARKYESWGEYKRAEALAAVALDFEQELGITSKSA
jgi:hypothetical protein